MTKFQTFQSLHKQDDILFLPNVWDVLSAVIIEQAGYKAIGTTSYGLANAKGFNDGEKISFDMLVEVAEQIIRAVSLPVSVDIEAGFASDADTIAKNVLKIADIGGVGINIEDSYKDRKGLRSITEQAVIIKTVREKLDRNGYKNFFINTRLDTYLQGQGVGETIERANSYIENGANGIFVPGLSASEDIKKIVRVINTPLNVMSLPNLTSVADLSQLGVKRLSMGNAFSDAVIAYIEKTAKDMLAAGNTQPLYEHREITTSFMG